MDTLFYRQPRLVILALVVILSAGLSALVSIGRQEDPTITNIFATVTTVFPGADPSRVEALVKANPVRIPTRYPIRPISISIPRPMP